MVENRMPHHFPNDIKNQGNDDWKLYEIDQELAPWFPTKNFLESLRLWLKNLYIFDAIFDWDHEKNIEPIISLKYDVPKWYKNNQVGISNFKKEVNYKMVYNKKNENLKNEIITLHGRQDKTYAVGKYFHQMYVNIDDILKSSIEVK